MGFGDFIKSLFSSVEVRQENDPARRSVKIGSTTYTPVEIREYMAKAAWRICKDYIAAAVSKAEIRTFLNGKEIFGEEYYRWNFKPNVNQSSTEFWVKAVNKYFDDGELLIIPWDMHLIIADHFNRDEYALLPAIFRDVSVGDFTFNRTFSGDEVMYFKLPEGQSMKYLIAGAEKLIDDTLSEAFDKYRLEGGERGTFTYDSVQTGSDEDNEKLEEILNEDFARYFQAKNAVIPLFEGMKYEPVTNPNGQKTSIVADMVSLMDLSVKLTAESLKIPPALILGNVADTKTALGNFLTFCVDPFLNMVTEGANACLYGKRILKGSYLSADSSNVEHVDIFAMAEKIDKLIAASIVNTNEVRRKIGEPMICEPWADEYSRTKNYETVKSVGKDDNYAKKDSFNGNGEQDNADGNEASDGSGDEG